MDAIRKYLGENIEKEYEKFPYLTKPDILDTISYSLGSGTANIKKRLKQLAESYEKSEWNWQREAVPSIKRLADDDVLLSKLESDVKGVLYKGDLADEAIPKMLDWDKPLSQQPEILKKLDDAFGDSGMLLDRFGLSKESSGGELHGLLSGAGLAKQPAASKKLSELGIPGIQYLDAGSRGAGQGTRNFVVFRGNEGILKILDVE